MSEMIERVARAICTTYGDVYDEQPADLETLREWRRGVGGVVKAYDPGLPTQKDWKDMARAAIEAQRNPTEAMMEASRGALRGVPRATFMQLELSGSNQAMQDFKARRRWHAMIDAMLAD